MFRLQFAERAKSIEVNVNVNETYDNIELLHQYEIEIERLKSILQEKIEATGGESRYNNIPPDMEEIVNENEKVYYFIISIYIYSWKKKMKN